MQGTFEEPRFLDKQGRNGGGEGGQGRKLPEKGANSIERLTETHLFSRKVAYVVGDGCAPQSWI